MNVIPEKDVLRFKNIHRNIFFSMNIGHLAAVKQLNKSEAVY